MLNTTLNLALRIIQTVFLYSDVDKLSVVDLFLPPRICEDSHGFTKICETLQGFMRIHKNLCGFASIYKNLCGITRIYKDLCGCMRICMDLPEFVQIH